KVDWSVDVVVVDGPRIWCGRRTVGLTDDVVVSVLERGRAACNERGLERTFLIHRLDTVNPLGDSCFKLRHRAINTIVGFRLGVMGGQGMQGEVSITFKCSAFTNAGGVAHVQVEALHLSASQVYRANIDGLNGAV